MCNVAVRPIADIRPVTQTACHERPKALSDATNYAVVQLPGRAFPGVVIQGDSLHSLIAEIEEAGATNDPDEQKNILNEVVGSLKVRRLDMRPS
jgi:hypothetical protein